MSRLGQRFEEFVDRALVHAQRGWIHVPQVLHSGRVFRKTLPQDQHPQFVAGHTLIEQIPRLRGLGGHNHAVAENRAVFFRERDQVRRQREGPQVSHISVPAELDRGVVAPPATRTHVPFRQVCRVDKLVVRHGQLVQVRACLHAGHDNRRRGTQPGTGTDRAVDEDVHALQSGEERPVAGGVQVLEVQHGRLDVIQPIRLRSGGEPFLVLPHRPRVPINHPLFRQFLANAELVGREIRARVAKHDKIVVARFGHEYRVPDGERVHRASAVIDMHSQEIHAPGCSRNADACVGRVFSGEPVQGVGPQGQPPPDLGVVIPVYLAQLRPDDPGRVGQKRPPLSNGAHVFHGSAPVR